MRIRTVLEATARAAVACAATLLVAGTRAAAPVVAAPEQPSATEPGDPVVEARNGARSKRISRAIFVCAESRPVTFADRPCRPLPERRCSRCASPRRQCAGPRATGRHGVDPSGGATHAGDGRAGSAGGSLPPPARAARRDQRAHAGRLFGASGGPAVDPLARRRPRDLRVALLSAPAHSRPSTFLPWRNATSTGMSRFCSRSRSAPSCGPITPCAATSFFTPS